VVLAWGWEAEDQMDVPVAEGKEPGTLSTLMGV
jgi:hypothetical protein